MFNGDHVGTPATTEYLADCYGEEPPKLIVCGHIHEAGPLGKNPEEVKGLDNFGRSNKTYIVNPGNLGRFELVDMPTLQTVMQFDFFQLL